MTQQLERLRRITWWMDEGIRIPGIGIRIGLDPIIGLIPGFGDAAGAILAGSIVVEAARTGISRFTLMRMAGNIALDAAIGAVPVIGDLFDAGWKANQKNVRLLTEWLDRPHRAERGSRRFVVWLVLALVVLAGICSLGTWLLLKALFGS